MCSHDFVINSIHRVLIRIASRFTLSENWVVALNECFLKTKTILLLRSVFLAYFLLSSQIVFLLCVGLTGSKEGLDVVYENASLICAALIDLTYHSDEDVAQKSASALVNISAESSGSHLLSSMKLSAPLTLLKNVSIDFSVKGTHHAWIGFNWSMT